MGALLAKALAIAVVAYGPCPPPAPMCASAPNAIYVTGQPAPFMALQHELGHVIDYNFLTDSDRAAFERLIHTRRPWRSAPNSPHEQFAEAVRLCAHSTRWPAQVSYFGYAPKTKQHRRICGWLETLD